MIGGGLAGITAAIALRDAGVGVTLLESRPRLGGAASSYARAARMRSTTASTCSCAAATSLPGAAGPARRDRLGGDPGPLRRHGAVAGRAGQAAPRRAAEPAAPGRGAGQVPRCCRSPSGPGSAGPRWRFRLADPASPALDGQRLGDWLAARGQGERARRRLWDLFVVSALNIAGDDASVQLAATVIKTALLGARDAADIGMATVPLGELHATAAASAARPARRAGPARARVAAIERLPAAASGWAWRTARSSGSREADGQPVSRGRRRAGRAAGPGGPAGRAGWPAAAPGWADLGYSPIVNVHVIYDRRVTGLPFAAAVDSPVQWVFDKTRPGWPASRAVPGGVAVGRRRLRRRAGGRAQASCSCPRSSSCSRPPPGPASLISSSPGNVRRRSGRRQVLARCDPVPRLRCRDSRWPVRGPTPAGRTPWRVRCEAGIQPRSS